MKGVAAVARLMPRAAPSQSGIFDGQNPSHFDSTDPIKLWIIQIGIILTFTHILALCFSRIRQPRVIAEVIGGIILGPTVMGRIPGFTSNIFPPASLPYLNLTSTIALVLFLFLIGLEIDVRTMGKNLRNSALISIAGMLLPFGLGAAVSRPIYDHFVDHTKVSFSHFLLFCCVALSITAFPVLCRILVELKLLDTTVGVVVLAAGVGNDVVGWVLLALTVALVNTSSGLTALWVLLTGVGWTLFLLFPVKIAFRWFLRRTGALETGQPTPFVMSLIFLIVFTSAFFTDIIGIHPIFGGFLAGLVIPHEGGLAISVVEKIEDLVVILFLPIYFTLSGLRTNLGLLNNGITWGYTILLIVVAFFGKFIGCAGVARLTGFDLRESGAIGALMSCKGLVELIVLNIGLQAGILDTRLFSMFVIMALILTIMTTPLTLWVYPSSIRKLHNPATRDAPFASSDESAHHVDDKVSEISSQISDPKTSRLAVVLEHLDHLPAIMALVQLFRPRDNHSKNVNIDALRLIELTNRTSAVMRGSDADDVLRRDALMKVFRMFGRLNRIFVTPTLSVAPQTAYASHVAEHAASRSLDLIILPLIAGLSTSDGNQPSNGSSQSLAVIPTTSYNPFQSLFSGQTSSTTPLDSSAQYSQYIREVFIKARCDVALIIDRVLASENSDGDAIGGNIQHLFLPFFGGPDDRLALAFVLQICANNPAVSATIVRVSKLEGIAPIDSIDSVAAEKKIAQSNSPTIINGIPDTIYDPETAETRLISQTADHLAWMKARADQTLPNVAFHELDSPNPLHETIGKMSGIVGPGAYNKAMLIVCGRSRRLAAASHELELRNFATEYKATQTGALRKTVGDVAAAFVLSTSHPLLVLQKCVLSSSA